MAKIFDLKDKQLRPALCYGYLPIGHPNAVLILHETLAVGTGIQVTLRQALGAAPFDGVDSLSYNGHIISPDDYIFHSGDENDAPDAYFPDRPPAPGAAHLSVRLPVGIADDNDPTKLVGNFRCLKVADYDANGNNLGVSFSNNPARVAMDLIKRARPRMLQRIDWAAWCEWRDFCAVMVNCTVNGAPAQRQRFTANIYVPVPFRLKDVIDWICQKSCTDVQGWTEGAKIRFLAPINRDPVFTFDLTQVSMDDYKFVPADRKNRPNMVVGHYKNVLDPYYRDADPPFELRRAALITEDGGIENPLPIDFGVCHPAEVECVSHYWARTSCDIPEYSAFLGGFMTYKPLPADLMLFTHDIPGYEDKQFKIIEKEENDDDGLGFPYKATPYPSNAYSDTDQSAWTQEPGGAAPSKFAAPPAASLNLTPQNTARNDGTIGLSVFIEVSFGDFAYKQIGKIYYKPPGGDWEHLADVEVEPGENWGVYRKTNLPVGVNTFKVVVYSEYKRKQEGISEEDSVNVGLTAFTINNTVIENGVLRAYTGFDASGKYTGRDTLPVPTSRINAGVTLTTVKDNGLNVDFELQGRITNRSDQGAQSDSLEESEVTVYNKFGVIAKKINGDDAVFFDDYKGAGTLASGDFIFKYAHPREEAYYKIRVRNSKGWSGNKYLYSDGTLSTVPPTPKILADCPQNMSASTLSSFSIRFNATFNFGGGKTLRLQKREIGQAFADWTDHVTGINALPCTANGLPSDKELEYRFVSSAGVNNASNIIRQKTWQIGQDSPTRSAPSGLSIVPEPSDPDDDLNVDWVRVAPDNDAVELEINGVVQTLLGGGGVTHYDIDGIGQLASRTVRVRNKWNSGETYSEWTDYMTGQTQATPVLSPPQNFGAVFDNPNNEIDSSWTHGDGAGNYVLEISESGANPQAASGTGGWTNITSGISPGDTSYPHAFGQTSSQQSRWMRIKRADVGGWVVSGEVIVPAEDAQGNLPPEITALYWSYIYGAIVMEWVTNGGSGTFTIIGRNIFPYQSNHYGVDNNAGAHLTQYLIYGPAPSADYDQVFEFKIARNDVPGESQPVQVTVYREMEGGPGNHY